MSVPLPLPATLVLGALCLCPWLILYVQRLRRRPSIRNLQGPTQSSFLFGNTLELQHQAQAGELEYEWVTQYGNALRIAGCFGEEILLLSDPKALHHILHASKYDYPKKDDVNQTIRLFMGKGIFWASGDTHKRHKKVMNPAFEANKLRSFVPLFHRSAVLLGQKWREELKEGSNVVNVAKPLSSVTLDNIGEAAFNYHFNALEGGGEGELSRAFENLFADSMLRPPKSTILFTGMWRFIPPDILRYVEYLPMHQLKRLRHFLIVSRNTAKSVLDQKMSGANAEDKDILSILISSNSSEDPKRRLDEDEILSQMATIMLAGHDSTASSLSWLFLDLSRNPEDQRRIREEIVAVRAKSLTPGTLSAADMDAMTYTNAVIKESLRLNPIAFMIPRRSARDDVIPLSNPIITKSGDLISEIAIPKGQAIYVSIFAYNRLPSVWGPDANEWNPGRFLGEVRANLKQMPLGVYANLLNFAGGVRGCLGWRFAILEMQAILIGIIEHFEFSPPPDGVEIMRVPAGSMIPVIKGREGEGTQLPLRIALKAL